MARTNHILVLEPGSSHKPDQQNGVTNMNSHDADDILIRSNK